MSTEINFNLPGAEYEAVGLNKPTTVKKASDVSVFYGEYKAIWHKSSSSHGPTLSDGVLWLSEHGNYFHLNDDTWGELSQLTLKDNVLKATWQSVVGDADEPLVESVYNHDLKMYFSKDDKSEIELIIEIPVKGQITLSMLCMKRQVTNDDVDAVRFTIFRKLGAFDGSDEEEEEFDVDEPDEVEGVVVDEGEAGDGEDGDDDDDDDEYDEEEESPSNKRPGDDSAVDGSKRAKRS
ncbi:hypothetical protein SeLEV6574_g07155 [Synchytrium endobioticum]|uniref:Uncharacterized protein n=1 Tax=Synchytrium endobioticum TaxID=286115 RepID=A0A507CJ73_9FUNG|nr:hypothetical protein SeLEV6574_g07155 [Synchytrium endobioticum]